MRVTMPGQAPPASGNGRMMWPLGRRTTAAIWNHPKEWWDKRREVRPHRKRRRDQLAEYRTDQRNRNKILTTIALKVGGLVVKSIEVRELYQESTDMRVVDRYLQQLKAEGLISIEIPEGYDDLTAASLRLTPCGKSRADDNLDKGTDWKRVLIGASVAILVAWFAVPGAVRLIAGSLDNAGKAGDTFGTVNALFSGFALAGVIYAIILQRGELRLQRQELGMTREELRRTAEAQEASQEALSEQARVANLAAARDALEHRIVAIDQELKVHYSGRSSFSRRCNDISEERELRTKQLDAINEQLWQVLSGIDVEADSEPDEAS